MSEKVKRYNLNHGDSSRFQPAQMDLDKDGDYVSHSDYAALAEALRAAVERAEALQKLATMYRTGRSDERTHRLLGKTAAAFDANPLCAAALAAAKEKNK